MKTLNQLKNHKLYRLAKNASRPVRRKLRQLIDPYQKVVSLKPPTNSQGDVLLSYVLDPFLLAPGQSIPNTHSNYLESVMMARTFLDLGYSVDAIHWSNQEFQPKKDYAVLIDSRWNMQRLAPLLNQDCLKIMHVDVGHILFHSAAQAARLLALQQRRGVTLSPRRLEMPNLAIEFADCATVLGNQFTLDTYRYANKPLYRVPILSCGCYPWPDSKDFDACRKRFLWFGSGGFVHKGLDLVLEAFVGMPDYHLTVCGPISGDDDFERAYWKELYETPNIETVGWVDIDGPKFRQICSNSLALIYASCSEGGGGCVITCMHGSVIPLVTYESSVDVHDFGMILPGCSIEQIQNAVRSVSSLPGKQLEQMARGAWEYARANHTKEKFAQEYRKVIEHILAPGTPQNKDAEPVLLTAAE